MGDVPDTTHDATDGGGLPPVLEAYLLSHRGAMAPVIAEAVGALDLPPEGTVLDAGTGAGGALATLASAAPRGRVRGVDVDPRVLALAAREIEHHDLGERVDLRAVDVATALADPPTGGFAAIWSSELLWPGNVGVPGDTVAAMASVLAPGGTVAIFSGNYHRSVVLPGRPRLERLLATASELAWGLPQEGADHYERHVRWLAEAGLVDVALRVLPRVVGPGEDEAGRAYLLGGVFPELLASARSHGVRAGMSDTDLEETERLLAPGSPEHVLDEPGYHAVLPTLLATGRRAT